MDRVHSNSEDNDLAITLPDSDANSSTDSDTIDTTNSFFVTQSDTTEAATDDSSQPYSPGGLFGDVLDNEDIFEEILRYHGQSSNESHSTYTGEEGRHAHEHVLTEFESDTTESSATEMTEESNQSSPPIEEPPPEADPEEPPAKVRKISSPDPEDNDANDGQTCPICLDSWGNSGDHRLVALKCGHLFGFNCVERWIRSKGSKDRCCPTCKTRASMKDIRYIYAKKLVAVDTAELTALQEQVETMQREKSQVEMELQTTKMEHRSLSLQMELLRKTLAASSGNVQFPRRNWRFSLDKNLEVWRDGGCRVLAYNCRTYEFYVSQKTTNSLFPGYGVRPVSCLDYKLGPFVPLHPKAIRDVAYSQPTDLLMSVGLDGAVKIVERGITATSIQCGMPLWSCAWDHARPNRFYVGGVGGIIMSYDVRNTNAVVETISTPGDMSPSVSLVSTEFGLLSCQLNSAWLWRSPAEGARPQPLPARGPFVSLCYDRDSKRVAVSCRPGATERAKVTLYKMNRTASDDVSFDLVQNMFGSSRSSVMSRAAFVKCSDCSWMAAYSESDSALLLHPIDGGRSMSLPAAEAALDVSAGNANGDTILAALSDSRLRLYKAYPTNSYS